jgi:hypothetical protein
LSVSSNFIAHAWSKPNAICLATNPFGTVVFFTLLSPWRNYSAKRAGCQTNCGRIPALLCFKNKWHC